MEPIMEPMESSIRLLKAGAFENLAEDKAADL